MACSHASGRPGWLRALAIAWSAGFTLAFARLARAEEPGADSPSSQPASPAVAAVADEERDEPLARARAVTALAEPLFAAGHYAAALAEYTRAYEILAGHPRQYWVLHNLATCNERLFRYDLAVELYEEYLRRAPPTETDRGEVSAILETLRSLLATLVVESSVAGEVWLDDRRLGIAPGKWRVPAGHHTVELRADRHESQRREVQLEPRQVQVDRFQLQLLSTYAGPPPGYFWAAVGLTGAATVAGATAGFMALNARQQGIQQAELHLDTSAQAERTRRLALASDVGFGAAVVFGATATVLYFVTDWPKPGHPAGRGHEPSAQRSLSIALAAPGGFGATLCGKF
jgi:tetratricopeptide (TPR) repeat protein